MIIATLFLVGALTCCAHSLSAPPVVAALDPDTHEGENDEAVNLPDKRILKYLLPSNPSWGISGVNDPIPTGQEGTKRGYSDRNFLRFGRSDVEKRAGNRNFLRFGRGDSEDYEDAEDETSKSQLVEKRNRNFLRFGRGPSRNFIRFGRSGLKEYGLEGTPLEFARGLPDEDSIEEEKRAGHKNYLRFGRGNRNFLRFGRSRNSNNFLRFGRSVDPQTFCDNCEEKDNLNKQPSATSSSSSSSSMDHVDDNNKHIASDDHISSETDVHRAKRSAQVYYDYASLPSHGPAAWARDYQPAEEMEVEEPELEEEAQEINKRNYNRNFLRFGRDRNFLRFGKRVSSDGSNLVMMESPSQYPRIIRAPSRNFIRFG